MAGVHGIISENRAGVGIAAQGLAVPARLLLQLGFLLQTVRFPEWQSR
jgi:hypothetical protein